MTIDRAGPQGITGRLLVVDPDETARAAYRAFLSNDACDIVEACDGRDALVKAFVRRPSVVITELRVPGMDGLGLCDVLRRDAATSDVPLLVITDEHNESQIVRARSVADAVLIKPVTKERLTRELAALICRSKHAISNAATLAARAKSAVDSSRRLAQEHRHFRTTTPPVPSPTLTCPLCCGALTYEHSYVGGVNDRFREQWDYLRCPREQTRWQYRHRTRKLRLIGPTGK